MGGGRILIADDQPHVRQIVSRELREEGYETSLVDNARSLWVQLKAYRPDVVLLNSLSEGFDSFDLLIDIKDEHMDLPVLVYVYRSRDALDRLKETISAVLTENRLAEVV